MSGKNGGSEKGIHVRMRHCLINEELGRSPAKRFMIGVEIREARVDHD